eukprot:g45894.t1
MKQCKMADNDTSLPDTLKAFCAWFEQNTIGVAKPAPTAPDTPVPSATTSELRKKGGEHTLIYLSGTEVEREKSNKFLGVTITDNLSWIFHVGATVTKTQQRLFFH